MVTCLLNKQVLYFVFTFLKSEKKIKSLAMSYSHMGKPHTTIGAIVFHFWVRHGIRWVHNAMVAKQNFAFTFSFFKNWRQNNLESLLKVLSLQTHSSVCIFESIKTPWVLYG